MRGPGVVAASNHGRSDECTLDEQYSRVSIFTEWQPHKASDDGTTVSMSPFRLCLLMISLWTMYGATEHE